MIQQLIGKLFCLFLRVSTGESFPPPLPISIEREYFVRLKSGDTAVREELIAHNLRLVAHLVKKYYASSHCQDDLISIGTVGLIKAVDSFDISKGARFATYAGTCIQNEILMYFRAQKKSSSEVSINDTIETDKDGNPLTYLDVISCEDTIAEDIDLKIESAKAIAVVERTLSGREKQIIILRYGLDGNRALTQREIAERLGISRSYVSRIEKSAMDTIRRNFFDIR